ncbi:MAG: HAMP domain-containing histidine kinase [Rhizobiaceae bacterium]|nr:HAMP domain-containing histidine kinase [Rhizobiaceae bacterium]
MAFVLPSVLRTTAARLSALYLLLFGVCAVVLVFYMTSLSVSLLTTQTMETINEEAASLGRAYQRGGIPLLVRMVGQRSRQPGANLYLIADSHGRILAGNVENLQPGVLEINGWTEVPFRYERYGEGAERTQSQNQTLPDARTESLASHDAIALVLRLPNEMIIMVGRDLGEPQRFRDVVRQSLMIALGMMALGGILIWFLVGRRALIRIDNISKAGRRIMGGDLSGRLPVTGAGDEFDRLSENLNAMLARIASLNEGLRQVSDNIAHDLKTPLTRLRNRAEGAIAANADPQEYREALEQTIRESDQLIKTFNAILMISRLEAGYSSEQVVEVDMTATVQDVIELYEPLSEEMGVSLDVSLEKGIAIRGNRELIAQALSNVIDNAIKYATLDGKSSRVRVKLQQGDGKVRLSVSDDGPGIPEATDRERVTERFVRLEKSRSQPGSGLGLSLAKAVMKFHNGTLDLLPENPGLTVLMTFPGR